MRIQKGGQLQALRLVVLMLAKNEESTIGAIIDELRQWARRRPMGSVEWALVDDSIDKTAEIAREKNVTVIMGEGKGLGHSYLKGVRWAVQRKPKWIVTLDADGQVDLAELDRFLNTAQERCADLVLGSRFLKKGQIQYSYPWMNRVGVFCLAIFLRATSGAMVTDSHGGLRVYSLRAAEAIKLRGHHTYVQESILSIAKKGFRIVEVSSTWNPRKEGESRVVSSPLRYMLKMSMPLVLTGLDCLYSRWRS